MTDTFSRINRAALDAGYLKQLYPNAKQAGRELQVGDIQGSPGRSMCINLDSGAWIDNATSERGGDLISLVAARDRISQAEAAKTICRALGLDWPEKSPRTGNLVAPRAKQEKPQLLELRPMAPPDDVGEPDFTQGGRAPSLVSPYRDVEGRLVFYIARYEARSKEDRKLILPYAYGEFAGKAGWHKKMPPGLRPLLGLWEMAQSFRDDNSAQSVLVVEGEKTYEAARRLLGAKYHVLTWAGGSQAISKTDWRVTDGLPAVYIWPDADQAGHKAAQQIAHILNAYPEARVYMVQPPEDASDGWDIADAEIEGWTTERLEDHIRTNAALVERSSSPPPTTGAGAKPANPPSRWAAPTIVFDDSQLPAIISEIIETIPRANKNGGFPLIMQRDGFLVRIAKRGEKTQPGRAAICRVHELTVPYLRHYLTQIINFVALDRRKKGSGLKEICAPKLIAETLLSLTGEYAGIQILNGMVTHPTIAEDGRVLSREGYDQPTGLYLDFGGRRFPGIPTAPGRKEAEQALSIILDLFAEFPFQSSTDMAVAISFLLSSLVRQSLPTSPGFAIDAATRGTGKSWLVSVISLAVAGREPLTVNYTSDQKEMSQRLFSILKAAGGGIILLDNVEQALFGDALNTAITSPEMTNRVLGVSEIQTVSTSVTFGVTGNNLVIQGDLTTRFLPCRLDAKMEHPEHRAFKRNAKKFALERGPEIVTAGLTVLKAYSAADDKPEIMPWRFNEWNQLIRGSLLWLGLPDPLASLAEMEKNDPERAGLGAVLKAWHEVFHDKAVSVKEAMDPDIGGQALSTAVGNGVYVRRGAVNNRAFGRWIMARKERRVEGLRFVKAGEDRNGMLWRVLQD